MILQKEIRNISEYKNLPSPTIDKDWVLGHILNGIYNHETLQNRLVFKGGTCLRKCYYKDYRFSEDLDFTLLDQADRIEKSEIQQVLDIVEKNSGIGLYSDNFKETMSNDIGQGYKITIKYWGANHKPNQERLPTERWTESVKFDISYSEKLELAAQSRLIFHEYTDKENISARVLSYKLEEIIAEKIRSLYQRTRPRDCYDLWYIFENENNLNWHNVKETFYKKAIAKQINLISIEDLFTDNKVRDIKENWMKQLGYQIAEKELPSCETAIETIKNNIKKQIHEQ